MRVLVISPYAPERCGIASYAVQLAASLRRDGHHVEVLSREPSAADHHADLHTRSGMVEALSLSRKFDRTIVEFFPDLFFTTLRRTRFVPHYPWVALLFRLGRNVELVIHEAPYEALRGASGFRGRVVRSMWRTLVRLPRATFVHTAWERDQLTSATRVEPERIQILEHGQSFFTRTRMTRSDAREELGLTDDKFHFLCIGFLQVHKGFDRAVRAAARLPSDRTHLHIVGSMRVQAPEIEEYVAYLRELVDATPGATLHLGYVTDELFDRWIQACDAVVLPYREIWSSGVVERAKLFGRPAIVTDVGGMRDQAGDSRYVVENDVELGERMAQFAGVPVASEMASIELGDGEQIGGDAALALVRRRADLLRERFEPGIGRLEARLARGAMSAPASLPLPPMDRSLRSRVKRVVHQLTRWQLAPLVRQTNDLRAYVAALEEQLRGHAVAELGAANARSIWLQGELARLGQLRSEDRRELSMALARLRQPAARGHEARRTDDEINGSRGGRWTGPGDADIAVELAALYEAHQDRFRGTSESIRRRLEAYVSDVADVFAEGGGRVLDIGPGRCEWLELLRQHGIDAYGVDINERFVRLATERKFDVRLEDGVSHLRGVHDGSLAAITAFHVVEHIPVTAVIELVDQSLRALRPGGILVLETPNPLNLPVGAAWFHLDWTHVRPIHPLFLQFVLETRGFATVSTTAVHPPSEAPVFVPPYEQGSAVRRMAELINRHFFTGEDYVVIGRRAPATDVAPPTDHVPDQRTVTQAVRD